MKLKFNDFKKIKPEDGESLIWVWANAGEVASGDYYNGQVRVASQNYRPLTKKDIFPTHWIKWSLIENWPV